MFIAIAMMLFFILMMGWCMKSCIDHKDSSEKIKKARKDMFGKKDELIRFKRQMRYEQNSKAVNK